MTSGYAARLKNGYFLKSAAFLYAASAWRNRIYQMLLLRGVYPSALRKLLNVRQSSPLLNVKRSRACWHEENWRLWPTCIRFTSSSIHFGLGLHCMFLEVKDSTSSACSMFRRSYIALQRRRSCWRATAERSRSSYI